MRRYTSKLIMVLFCVFVYPSFSLAEQHFEKDAIILSTTTGQHRFIVEIADTYAKRKQGLMHRTHLPQDHGMLFVFGQERPLSFWMKDTPLSLDLIFFDGMGEYVSHHSNATPNSTESIKSSGASQFVLEINAGLAKRLMVGKGTKIIPSSSQL